MGQFKCAKLKDKEYIGVFPNNWKEGIVTPVLKKGDKAKIENYRPVSCLPAAAKLLELLVCNQTTEYMEEKLIKQYTGTLPI